MFNAVVLKAFSGKSKSFVPLELVSEDLFCSFEWTTFPCLSALSSFVQKKKAFKKIATSPNPWRLALWRWRPSPLSLAWRLKVFSGLFRTYDYPGPVYVLFFLPNPLQHIGVLLSVLINLKSPALLLLWSRRCFIVFLWPYPCSRHTWAYNSL